MIVTARPTSSDRTSVMPSFHPPEEPNTHMFTTLRVERDHHSSHLLQADRHIGQAEHVQDWEDL
jgi:hypothetical protein